MASGDHGHLPVHEHLALGALAAEDDRYVLPGPPFSSAYIGHVSGLAPTLYHGTSTDRLQAILAVGLRRPCLTDDEDLARYYAGECAEASGGEPVVLAVTGLHAAHLVADVAAISEPVMVGVTEAELWERADRLVEELEVEGWAKIPWDSALDLCRSVRHDGDVSAALVSVL